jgi:hypothetical protein
MSSFPGSKTDKSGPFPDRGLPDLLFWNEVRFGRKANIQIDHEADLLHRPNFGICLRLKALRCRIFQF